MTKVMSPAAIAASTAAGSTALHLAAGNGLADICNLLCQTGYIDLNATNGKEGKSARDCCLLCNAATDEVLQRVLTSFLRF